MLSKFSRSKITEISIKESYIAVGQRFEDDFYRNRNHCQEHLRKGTPVHETTSYGMFKTLKSTWLTPDFLETDDLLRRFQKIARDFTSCVSLALEVHLPSELKFYINLMPGSSNPEFWMYHFMEIESGTLLNNLTLLRSLKSTFADTKVWLMKPSNIAKEKHIYENQAKLFSLETEILKVEDVIERMIYQLLLRFHLQQLAVQGDILGKIKIQKKIIDELDISELEHLFVGNLPNVKYTKGFNQISSIGDGRFFDRNYSGGKFLIYDIETNLAERFVVTKSWSTLVNLRNPRFSLCMSLQRNMLKEYLVEEGEKGIDSILDQLALELNLSGTIKHSTANYIIRFFDHYANPIEDEEDNDWDEQVLQKQMHEILNDPDNQLSEDEIALMLLNQEKEQETEEEKSEVVSKFRSDDPVETKEEKKEDEKEEKTERDRYYEKTGSEELEEQIIKEIGFESLEAWDVCSRIDFEYQFYKFSSIIDRYATKIQFKKIENDVLRLKEPTADLPLYCERKRKEIKNVFDIKNDNHVLDHLIEYENMILSNQYSALNSSYLHDYVGLTMPCISIDIRYLQMTDKERKNHTHWATVSQQKCIDVISEQRVNHTFSLIPNLHHSFVFMLSQKDEYFFRTFINVKMDSRKEENFNNLAMAKNAYYADKLYAEIQKLKENKQKERKDLILIKLKEEQLSMFKMMLQPEKGNGLVEQRLFTLNDSINDFGSEANYDTYKERVIQLLKEMKDKGHLSNLNVYTHYYENIIKGFEKTKLFYMPQALSNSSQSTRYKSTSVNNLFRNHTRLGLDYSALSSVPSLFSAASVEEFIKHCELSQFRKKGFGKFEIVGSSLLVIQNSLNFDQIYGLKGVKALVVQERPGKLETLPGGKHEDDDFDPLHALFRELIEEKVNVLDYKNVKLLMVCTSETESNLVSMNFVFITGSENVDVAPDVPHRYIDMVDHEVTFPWVERIFHAYENSERKKINLKYEEFFYLEETPLIRYVMSHGDLEIITQALDFISLDFSSAGSIESKIKFSKLKGESVEID